MSDEPRIEPTANPKAKDSVFTDLFSDKWYLLELYHALHPEDKVTPEKGLRS